MKKDDLHYRLFYQPHLTELARFISYGGKREKEVEVGLDAMRKRFGEEKVRAGLHELTTIDDGTGLRVLEPNTRKLCRGLLGPAPEDDEYVRYYEVNRRVPPADHQPPGPEEEHRPKPRKRGRAR